MSTKAKHINGLLGFYFLSGANRAQSACNTQKRAILFSHRQRNTEYAMDIKKAVARAKSGNDQRKGRRMVTVAIAALKQFGLMFVDGAPKHESYRKASRLYGKNGRGCAE